MTTASANVGCHGDTGAPGHVPAAPKKKAVPIKDIDGGLASRADDRHLFRPEAQRSVPWMACGLLNKEGDHPLSMPQRPRRPPLLSRLPVWVWVALLCALVAGLVFKLRHVFF